MTLVHTDILEEVVKRLVEGLHPEQIYLFGSQARDQADAASDIDVLVVVSDADMPRHQREARSYELLWGITKPVDVIVLTRGEFERGRQVKTSLPARVETEGKILYGRSQST